MNSLFAIINAELLKTEEAKILISDLAIQRGYGVFDFFRTHDFNPLFLEDHLDRFYQSAGEMRLVPGMDREQLKKLVGRLIEINKVPDSGIKITLTGGYSEDGYSLTRPNLLITQSPFIFDKNSFNKGTRLVTYPFQRQLPQVKTIDYLQSIYLQPFIKEKDADDVLYYQREDITESPRSNFFVVTAGDEIITPANNILRGITRKRILELPEFNARESAIKLSSLENVKEAFITSTTKQVLPVLTIDGKTIGTGKPGVVTAKIYERLLAGC